MEWYSNNPRLPRRFETSVYKWLKPNKNENVLIAYKYLFEQFPYPYLCEIVVDYFSIFYKQLEEYIDGDWIDFKDTQIINSGHGTIVNTRRRGRRRGCRNREFISIEVHGYKNSVIKTIHLSHIYPYASMIQPLSEIQRGDIVEYLELDFQVTEITHQYLELSRMRSINGTKKISTVRITDGSLIRHKIICEVNINLLFCTEKHPNMTLY